MKRCLFALAMIHALAALAAAAGTPGTPGAACAAGAVAPAARPANRHYAVNREPLRQTARASAPRRGQGSRLAAGSTAGRSRRNNQLPVERISCAAADANPPYHQEGVVALALVLGDDPRLTALAKGYNTWPGQMTADMWCHQYDVQANQVAVSVAARGWDNSPWANVYGLLSNWTCCLANQHQGWPRLVENLWMATHDNGLLAAVYGPCEVAAKVGPEGTPVTISEETEYPFDGKDQADDPGG